MTEQNRNEVERAYWSLRVVRHNHRGEPWDMKFPQFRNFIETNSLEEVIAAPFATGGIYRPDTSKPWHRDNIAFDAKRITRRSRGNTRPTDGPKSRRILTKEEWVMQLKLDAMRAQPDSIAV